MIKGENNYIIKIVYFYLPEPIPKGNIKSNVYCNVLLFIRITSS